jgi:hypothetical protein
MTHFFALRVCWQYSLMAAKRRFLLFTAIFLLLFSSFPESIIAQQIVEDFSYPVGTVLNTQAGYYVRSGATINVLTVGSPGLTYAGYLGSGVGNGLPMLNNGEDLSRDWVVSPNPGINSGSIYFASLVNVSAAQATGDFFLSYQYNNTFNGKVFVKSTTGGFLFGSGKNTAVYEASPVRSLNTTYLVVVKYTFNTGSTTDDRIDFWVNPGIGGSEPTPTIANITDGTRNDFTNIGGVVIRQGTNTSAPTVKVDGFRVATDWATAVAPSLVPALNVSQSTLIGFSYIAGSGPSASQTYNLSGVNLDGSPVTVTGSTNYEVSTDNSSFSGSVNVPYSGTTLSATPMYVRLKIGLPAGNYNSEIVANGGGGGGTLNVTCSGSVLPAPTYYTWQGANLGDWTVASNWSPPRTTPYPNDMLQFNDGTNKVITNVPNETMGRLLISNNTAVEFQSLAPITLSINGGTGVDFDVQPGSALNIAQVTNAIVIALNTGATGTVGGSMTFSAAAHKLTAIDASGITFLSGSVFTAGTGFTSNAFGTSNLNSVVFTNGSKYIYYSGANLFGAGAPNSVVVLQAGSTYVHRSTGNPSLAGRVYANFELDEATGASFSSSSPVTFDNLIVTTGSWTLGVKAQFDIKRDITVAPGASLLLGPSTPGTIVFSGTVPQFINSSGSLTTNANQDISIATNSDVTFNCDLIVNGNLTVSTSGTCTIVSGVSVTTAGALTITGGGTLKVKSGASLITNGAVSGNAIVERFLTKYNAPSDNMYHFLASPVASQAIQTEFVNLPNTTDDFYSWDEVNNIWINSSTLSGTWNSSFENDFVVGKGYLIAYPADVTKSFTGVLNTGSISPALTYTTSGSGGWNLIGNPYPSAIDWDNVVAPAQYGNIDDAVYVWENANQAYLTWVGGAGSLTNGVIPAMQGFFVKANAASPTLTLENADRVHSSISFYKGSDVVENLVQLKIEGNDHHDNAFVRFTDEATSAFDSRWDAYKLKGGPAVPNLYSVSNGTQYSVNSLPLAHLELPVSLNVEVGANSTYSLSLVDNTLPANTYVILEDMKTGTIQKLNDSPVYTFTAATNDNPDRFKLHFKDATSVVDPSKASNVKVLAGDGYINIIPGNVLEGKISITDLAGRTVVNSDIIPGSDLIFNLNTGVYIVSVITHEGVNNQKVFVR